VQPRICRKVLFTRTLRCGALLICLLAAAVSVFGSGNVVIRENVSAAKREELASKLRAITGLSRLGFDKFGLLQLGTDHDNRGSQSARDLLGRAVEGNKVIVVEDASSRADVAFCRVVPGRWLSGNGNKLPAYVVLIDFSDFRQIIGDDEARAAFDVGWGFLHELDHVVAESSDSNEQGHIGECETHINMMRREIGLPQRVNYFFTESSLRADPNFGTKLVRLAFEQYDSGRSRLRHYWLTWDSRVVGGLIVNGQTAVVRSGRNPSN
jgi:hypothetical protein